LQNYWPDVFRSLQDDVLPYYEPRYQKTDSGFISVIEEWRKVKGDIQESKLLASLEGWAKQFRITEDWIFEAALDTLLWYHAQMETSRTRTPRGLWRYAPRGFHSLFEPVLTNNFWFPVGGLNESWPQFKKRMEREFKRQLSEYRNSIDARVGVRRKERIRIHAGWAVRYQRGESVADIFQTVDIGDLDDPEQAIYRSIERFAKNIGLNLKRRGARLPRTSVQRKH
jgi:hypothetical protein